MLLCNECNKILDEDDIKAEHNPHYPSCSKYEVEN